MLTKTMEKALNDQLNFELYSSYLYMSMTAALEAMNHKGAAHWMRIQSLEELFHANKLFTYILDRDGKAVMQEIKKPKTEWKTVLEVFEDAHKHEKHVTARICELIDLAMTEKDHVTNSTLQWFVNEQIEEESNGKTVIEKLKRAKNSPDGLLLVDSELAARVLSPLANVTTAVAATPA